MIEHDQPEGPANSFELAEEGSRNSGDLGRVAATRPRFMRSCLRRAASIAAAVVLVDQATKLWGHRTDTGGVTAPVHNPELALGIAGGPLLLLILAMTTALVGFGAYLIHRLKQGRISPLVVGLLVGGAAGNLIDRILFGSVRDFIPTPAVIFNIADVALLLGVIGYFLALITTPASKRTGGS